MPTCTYCKKNYDSHKGLTIFTFDGKSLFLCSSKCRRNMDLGRDAKKVSWIKKKGGKVESRVTLEKSEKKKTVEKAEEKKVPKEVLTMGADSGENVESKEKITSTSTSTGTGEILLKGLSASPGVAVGKVTKIMDIEELERVKKGAILVTTMTTPDMVPAMQRAAGIVTNEGGTTCHAAIVSRELGIPCIVGTVKATEVLDDGMDVTVAAKIGIVYDGITISQETSDASGGGGIGQDAASGIQALEVPATGTKVLLNLGVPDAAVKYSGLPVQGIGLMREEFIVGTFVKIHPNELIERSELRIFGWSLAAD